MKRILMTVATLGTALLLLPNISFSQTPVAETQDLDITESHVRYVPDLQLLVFEQIVAGIAGDTTPEAAGELDGAPVLGYVFPTTLSPEDVGFSGVEGIVALAATSHPDFDDTPLWDEDNSGRYDDDGVVFHSHWVLLGPDERVPGGLAVLETQQIDSALPPTNPGMPMYLDSPGFSIVLDGTDIRLVVPINRVNNRTDFHFDAVTAYMEVNTSDDSRPMLGAYEVYDVLSGDLSLPYSVSRD